MITFELFLAFACVGAILALLVGANARRKRKRYLVEPDGPAIFRESSASGREVSIPFNRLRGVRNLLCVEVFDDQLRFSLPGFLEWVLPIECSTGIPASLPRNRLHGVYAKGEHLMLEFEDHDGREKGLDLQLKRLNEFLAALQS